MKIVLATRNPHKLQEITAILRDPGVEWIPYPSLADGPPLREEGSSLRENAAAKAKAGAAFSGLIALAEDSALEVDALGGAPGIHSSRFLGERATDHDRIQEILRQLRTYPWHGRTARFRCVVAVAQPGGKIDFSEGVCEGYIAWEPKGTAGFGYDPIFYVSEHGRTLAEIGPTLKNQISHRAKALEKCQEILTRLKDEERF
ncbi:MAG: RdgB/HAM1 family non-canonical purine NTP pyrophosphatase [candidate division NC10 bacterium]|nr:RdgB/HAM1 family non-canonical purine NTP pyrophosphatase [candidate division NC10 bacterium]